MCEPGTLTVMHPVIGAMTPYFLDANLATGFEEFDTPTMQGLARVIGDRLDILAMHAKREGRGDGGRFLAELMTAYRTIGVWQILNANFAAMLERRGFRETIEWLDGNPERGMRWDAHQSEDSNG